MRQQGPGGRQPSPFFLIIDEFQLFLTPDIPDMLDQGAKYGIHLFLFHQHLSQLRQLDEQAFGAMSNARIKLVFGGLSRDDARLMAEEIFPGQIDLKRAKFIIEQTKFWPVYFARHDLHERQWYGDRHEFHERRDLEPWPRGVGALYGRRRVERDKRAGRPG